MLKKENNCIYAKKFKYIFHNIILNIAARVRALKLTHATIKKTMINLMLTVNAFNFLPQLNCKLVIFFFGCNVKFIHQVN